MSRHRTKEYTDIYLSTKEVKKLKKGYTILKHSKGQHVAIHCNPHDRKTVREIERLKAKIKALGGK